MSHTILTVTASVQQDASISRMLVSELLDDLMDDQGSATIIERDLSANDMALLTEAHVGAFYTPDEQRSPDQKKLLQQSDLLIKELKQADTLVIGTPMYNFSIPASLKAWIDLVCRVGETFRYTENGPEGLLEIDTAYLVVATGGAPVGSEVDFLVPYLTQIAKFIGVKQVKVVAADKTNQQRDAAIAQARDQIRSA